MYRNCRMINLDRLSNSIPCSWKFLGTSTQLSYDAFLPMFIVPLFTFIAAQNVICTVLIFCLTPMLLYYLHKNFLRFLLRTKFFVMWTLTSVLMVLLLFEISVVPLLEILPEENFVFILCMIVGLFCSYKTKQKADKTCQDVILLQDLELGERSEDICNVCKRKAPPKAYHCRLCQTCILGREYHCSWLDCCIGFSNIKWFLGCLLASAIAFIYGSNLIMTTICHPFVFIGTMLLPDDCSDVYHQLDIALCFVSSIYSLLAGLIILVYLIYHVWILYLGTTSNERLILFSENQNEKNLLINLPQLLCCNT